MDEPIETVSKWADVVINFLVAYGFQILGALLVLVIGLKIAGWTGSKTTKLITKRNIDVTLARFAGNLTKIVIVALVIVVTLGNFGITIAPLIAIAGASAFGATVAIQGPLSNYGAGLSIVLSRPFTVGDTITIRDVSGVVEEVKLAATTLIGEDGEKITVPNKEIVGRVIVNSSKKRIVEEKIAIAEDVDAVAAVELVRKAIGGIAEVAAVAPPQVGIHEFTYGGVVIGIRFWVPSRTYFQLRYQVNAAVLTALKEAGVKLLGAGTLAVLAPDLSRMDEGRPRQGA